MPSPTRCLTVCSASLLWLASGCLGGQSGDDGDDFVGGLPPPQPTGPTAPEQCGVQDVHPLEPDEPTAFEVTPAELVAGLTLPESPFHWVEYTSPNLTATHSPGPGTSTLNIELSLRTNPADLGADEAITEVIAKAKTDGPACAPQQVWVPVWIDVETADGALDARVKGGVTFYSSRVADLYARFASDALGGTFVLAAPVATDPNYKWSVSAYTLSATLWDGGSRGVLSPEFTANSAVTIGGSSAGSPPPLTPPGPNGESAIVVPEAWEAVGVWPRLEQCAPGVAVDVDDAIIGKSARDVLEALTARPSYSLSVRSNATSNSFDALDVQLTTTIPEGLVCVNATPQTGRLDLNVAAHLRATGSDPGVALDTDLHLTVSGEVDPKDPQAALTRVRFERLVDDAATPDLRATFESTTGVSLEGAPEEYSRIWWSWFGSLAPDSAALGSAPPESASHSRNATFIVTSPNARQTTEVDAQQATGGPGFGIGLDENGQLLPGDALLEAVLEEP